MSDTKIQVNNSKNKFIVQNLERLYKQERSIEIELKFCEKWKQEGQIYVGQGTLRNYDINWAIRILKGDLKIVRSVIKLNRSKLVIC